MIDKATKLNQNQLTKVIEQYIEENKTSLDYLKRFSTEQVSYITSDSLEDSKLIACAGSGKTRSIIGRIKYCSEQGLAFGNSLFMITFSRHAANDFREKAKDLFPNYDDFCDLNNFSTIDSLAKSFLTLFSSRKSDNIDILSIAFRNLLRDATEDQITTMLSHKCVKHLFVDEAQDLNSTQYDILMLMKKRFGTSVHLIGDPNQNVYQFRRSSSEFLQQFNGKKYELTYNFRSSPQIISFCEPLKPVESSASIPFRTANKPLPRIISDTSKNVHDLLLRSIRDYDSDLSNIAIICPTRGNRKRKNLGLSVLFNLLRSNGIKVTQMYQENSIHEERMKSDCKKGHVNLLTYHGSKGLEFDTVFLFDCYQSLFNRRPTREGHDENRYLLYVAASRAVNNLNLCVYSDVNAGAVNCWLRNIPRELYGCNKHLNIPSLTFDKPIIDTTLGITEILGKMTDVQLDMIDDMIKVETLHVREIYPDREIDRGNDASLFGIFCEQLLYLQYHLSRDVTVPIRDVIENIVRSRFVIVESEWEYHELQKHIVLPKLTWHDYHNCSLPKNVRRLVVKYFDHNHELTSYVLCTNSSAKIIKDNSNNIKTCYDRYLDPKSYDYKWDEILLDFFYLIVVEYAYHNNHYYYINEKGYDKHHLLESGKLLFQDMNRYVSNSYRDCSFRTQIQVRYDKLNLYGEIDFIEQYEGCRETIVEVKCVQNISIKYYIQLLLYNFCYRYDRDKTKLFRNKYKILNLLKGEELSLIISISPSDMWRLLEIVSKVGNLPFNEMNLVLDLETTGLITDVMPEVIEISIVDYETGMIVFDSLVKPKQKICRFIRELTGITNEMASNGISIDLLKKQLSKIWERFNDVVLIGHNIRGFDSRVMSYYNLMPKDYSLLDTLQLLPICFEVESASLSNIYSKVIGRQYMAHRSMNDVLALIEIMKRLGIEI